MRKKRWGIGLGMMLLAGMLAACSGNADNANPANGDHNASEAKNESADVQHTAEQPELTKENEVQNSEVEGTDNETVRELTDGLGNTVQVPNHPQRVLASYLEDYLVALDVEPVVQWSVSNGPMGYLQPDLDGIPLIPYDLPYEAVTAADPDVIIIGDESLLANDKFDGYNKIAPTYALGAEINADWRQALLAVGRVLNKESEAQSVLDNYENRAAEAKAKVTAAGEVPSATAIWLVAKTFWMVSEGESAGAVMYDELGLAVPELVQRISQSEGGIWKSVSMEALAELDADHIFLVNSDAQSGSEALQDPIWQTIKAVKDGNVHEFTPSSSWLYTGPIANSLIIEDTLQALGLE